MLPSNLLLARTRSGKIKPVLAPVEGRYVELASRLIKTYQAHVNKRKGELEDHCQRFEEIGFDYRFVRGLVVLLDRLATFKPHSYIDPQKARCTVFKVANRYPLVATEDIRQEVLAQAASQLELSVSQLEKSLWSDFEQELVLESFVAPLPSELIRQYNLSLIQTLLFRAASLEFVIKSNYQRIFSLLKRLGLMYAIEQTNGTYRVIVDGPTSLFKLTERYGTSLAKLVPSLVGAEEWSLKALILGGERQAPKLLELELSRRATRDLLPVQYAQRTEEQYDSSVEAQFARSFRALKLNWSLKREPELLVTGRHVFIPDFSFENNSLKAYLEIVGFWTDDYLQKKLAKLQQTNVENFLIAVDRSLSCSQLENVKGVIIYYQKKVPIRAVVAFLRQLEEAAILRQVETIDGSAFKLAGDLIEVPRLADEHAVSEGALRRWLLEHPPTQHRLVGFQLISERKLGEINKKLETLHRCTLSAAQKAIEEEGISAPEATLQALGFEVEWHGLDPDSATIHKKANL